VKREQWWPIGLVLTLAITVALNIVLMIAANAGDGAAVEPDYYRRAVAWDSSKAEEARSRSLGWTMTATLDGPASAGESMHLTIADASGAPIGGARVRVQGFALARSAATRTDLVLTEADGAYRALLQSGRVEWYEFHVTVDRGGSRFVATLRCLPGQVCREA
jgi:hypothetical protein